MILEDYQDNTPKIKVYIRKRPLGKKEIMRNEPDILEIRDFQTVVVKENKTKVDLTKYMEEHNFIFDGAFDQFSSNQKIYLDAIRPLVDASFNKAKVTCFAYGQTGSGKTFTMMGDPGSENKENGPTPGLYLLAAQDIFTIIENSEYRNISIWISFYEIYCGKLYDLLNERQQLFAREDAKQNVNIVGLQEKRILNVHTLMQLIEFGMSVRVTSQNSQNLDSSRSHAVLQIVLKDGNKAHGKLSFIDLAGSERAADVTDQNKQTRMDGAEINKSLLALKECIRALDQDKKHTPFRGSKLTLVLKDSFMGSNCKTVMIGNVSPGGNSCEHTLNTLRYADRVKELKKPQSGGGNVDSYDVLAQQLMLPRQNKNANKIFTVKEEDASNGVTGALPNQNSYSYNMNNYNQNGYGGQSNIGNPQNFFNQNNLGPAQNFFNQNNNNNGHNINMNGNGFYQQQDYHQNNMGMMNGNNNNSSKPRLSSAATPQINFPNKAPLMPNNIGNNNGYNNNNPNLARNHNTMEQFLQKNDFELKNPTPFFQEEKPEGVNLNNQYNQGSKLIRNNSTNSENVNNNVFNGKKIENNLNMNIYTKQLSNKTIPKNEPIVIQDDNLEEISQRHEQLIHTILSDEEEVIATHRKHIDDMVEAVKQEMMLLHEVDKPGSDVDYYVEHLDNVLAGKVNMINNLRNKLKVFKQHLMEEEILSKKFYDKKNEMDVYDLKNDNNCLGNDIQLLDNLHEVLN